MDNSPGFALAVLIEEAGIALYSRIVALLPDGSREQEEIEYLLQQETYHRSFYERLMEKTGEEFNPAVDHKTAVESVLKSVSSVLEKGLPVSSREALLVGAELERGSILYFSELLKKLPPGETRNRVKKIISEEKDHLQRINLLLDI